MNVLINILIISIFCNGWFIITHDGMIFDKFRQWLDFSIPHKCFLRYIYTPFIGCIICMSSFWGTLIYAIELIIKPQICLTDYLNYPIILIGSAFGNYLLFNLLELIKKNAQ